MWGPQACPACLPACLPALTRPFTPVCLLEERTTCLPSRLATRADGCNYAATYDSRAQWQFPAALSHPQWGYDNVIAGELAAVPVVPACRACCGATAG